MERRQANRKLKKDEAVILSVAMKITDHKTDSMFRRYAIVTVEQQRDALRAAESYRQHQKDRFNLARIN